MSELRTDKLTGRSVIIAENRALRPNEFAELTSAGRLISGSVPPAEAGSPVCPFCPGQEHLTPPAVHEVVDTTGKWQIRVVPNKYPAVTPPDEAEEANSDRLVDPTSQISSAGGPAIGVHEVVIESPRHVDRMSALSVRELQVVLQTYAARLDHWRADRRLRYGLVFKNQGPRAGASLAHLHSQFIALPAVPTAVEAELRRAEDAYRQDRCCPYCRLLQQERTFGQRIVCDDGEFVAFCPFASMQPYEIWLGPSVHAASFGQRPGATLDALAGVLHDVIRRVESIVPDAAYNLMLRTAPWGVRCDNWYHWRMELMPRITAFAGFELASGLFINPVAPERAASKLRSN